VQTVLAADEIYLGVGEDYLLTLPAVAKVVDVSDSTVLSIEKGMDKTQLILTGKKSGNVLIKVKLANGSDAGYQVRVGSRNQQVIKLLKQISGLKAVEKNGRVYVSGSIQNKSSVVSLNRIKRKFPGAIIDDSGKHIASSNTVVRTINRILKESDMANIQANSYGKIIVLEGSAKDPRQKELAVRIARLIYSGIEDRIADDSNGAPSINIEVMFVEASKGNDRTIGIKHGMGSNIPNGMQSGIMQGYLAPRSGSISRGPNRFNWQVGGLASFLELIQERTSSRVLSNPRLIARSGTEAKFRAGKTIYLSDYQVEEKIMVAKLHPVDAGISLKITPKIDEIGQIDTKIVSEVSEFGEIKHGYKASMSISKVDTAVTIKDGQTIMLSGLVKKSNSKTVTRVPILADIPVIGELFKSRRTLDAETETLILVTMNRVQGHDDSAKAAGSKLWKKAGGDVEFSLYD